MTEALYQNIAFDRVPAVIQQLDADPRWRQYVYRFRDDTEALPHVAAKYGSVDTLKVLIERGADPNVRSANGNTPAHFAAREGRESAVLALRDAGAKLDLANNQGKTPLHEAVQHDHEAIVNVLAAAGADVDAAQPFHEYTPLHTAAQRGNANIVFALLDNGADPNQGSDMLWTPMHVAVYSNRVSALPMLAQFNADLDAHDVTSGVLPPLQMAVDEDRPHAARVLLDLGADRDLVFLGETALTRAAARGDDYMVSLLLDRGADPDGDVANAATTPLLNAAANNHDATIALLIDAGASVDKAGRERMTPLMVAAETDSRAAIRTLLDFGADQHATDRRGRTAAQIAEEEGNRTAAFVLQPRY